MNIEDIIINLKVLEKVQIHEKLISRGQYLNIEYVSIVPLGLRRWWRQDNRNEMLKKINLTIKCAIEILPSMHQQCRIIEHSNKKTLDDFAIDNIVVDFPEPAHASTTTFLPDRILCKTACCSLLIFQN